MYFLCCASVGSRITAPILTCQRLKHLKLLIEHQDVFETLNRLESLSIGSLTEPASLHGVGPDFSTKDSTCDIQHPRPHCWYIWRD
jgi:hypothetical protein